jgi:hypothetical protein
VLAMEVENDRRDHGRSVYERVRAPRMPVREGGGSPTTVSRLRPSATFSSPSESCPHDQRRAESTGSCQTDEGALHRLMIRPRSRRRARLVLRRSRPFLRTAATVPASVGAVVCTEYRGSGTPPSSFL